MSPVSHENRRFIVRLIATKSPRLAIFCQFSQKITIAAEFQQKIGDQSRFIVHFFKNRDKSPKLKRF
jgi:hypothetical protein